MEHTYLCHLYTNVSGVQHFRILAGKFTPETLAKHLQYMYLYSGYDSIHVQREGCLTLILDPAFCREKALNVWRALWTTMLT